MIFKQEMLDATLAGKKTVTRRPVKYTESGKHLPARYKVDGGPGGTYALQGPPEEGSRARAKTIPGYRLRIVDVQFSWLLGISKRGEAEREGFKDAIAFLAYWHRMYGESDPFQGVWRYEFELVEVGE